jgi:hypothetical protein
VRKRIPAEANLEHDRVVRHSTKLRLGVRAAFLTVAVAGIAASSAAVATTSPKQNAPAQSSSPPTLPRPWAERVVASTNFTDTPITGSNSTMAYGVVPAGSGQHVYGRLDGINLVSGKIERGPLVFLDDLQLVTSGDFTGLAEPSIESVGPAGDAAGVLPSYWTLHRIDTPTTRLKPGHYLKVFGQIDQLPQLAPANGASEDLWGSSGRRVVLIDPTTGQELRSIPAPVGEVRGILASTSGALLYVSETTSQSGAISLFELDATTGHVLARTSFEPGLISVLPVATTTSDVWIASSGGMSTHFLTAYSSSSLQPLPATPSPQQMRDGRGLDGYTIELLGGAGWVAIPGEISCVSPTTGKVLASASIPSDDGDTGLVTPFAVVGRTLYVVQDPYSGPGSGSVRALSPSSACFTAD